MKTSSVRNLAYLIKKRLSGEERLAVDCEVALVAIPVRSTSGTSILNCRIASFVVSACVCVGIKLEAATAAEAARTSRRSGDDCFADMTFLLTANSVLEFHCKCPLLAQSGHSTTEFQCPLLGVKRTFSRSAVMSAFDPKRTSPWGNASGGEVDADICLKVIGRTSL